MKKIIPWLQVVLLAAITASGTPFAWRLAAQDADAPKPSAPKSVAAEDEEKKDAGAKATDQDNSGIGFNRYSHDIVRVGSSVEIKAGESVPEVVVVFGNATSDGEVRGDMVVVGGNVQVNGKVGGDLVVVFGNVALGPKADIRGDNMVVLGKLHKDPGAHIRGEQFELDLGMGNAIERLAPILAWFKSGLLLGRPIPPQVAWIWWIVGLHFLIYLIVAILLPKPVAACVNVLDEKAVQSFFVGLLALILFGPLALILVSSLIGLLVVPFLICAFMVATIVGKTSTFQYMGLQLIRRFSPEASPRSLVGFLIGTVLVCLLYMIPVLGFVVWGVLLPLGLGAALLAAFEGFKKSRPTDATGASQAGPIFVPSRPQSAAASAFTPGPTASSAEMPPSTPPPFPATLPPPDCISMPRVGFWLRLAATALDFILLVWLLSASGPLFLAAWLAYHVGMWTWKGTTIGGIVCSIKVVRLDGRPPDFSVALVRGLASVFSAVAAGMGFFWAGWSHEKQSWHDKIAGTVIVKVPRGVSLI